MKGLFRRRKSEEVEGGGGQGVGAHLKKRGVYKLNLILEGAFIGGRRLKEGGHLLEDLPYS